MSASIHARGVHLALGARHLLVDVEFAADPGQCVGVVGPNGVGKSTLLKVLAGLQPVDRGTLTLSPPDATVGYLAQEPERLDETVHDFLARRTGVAAAQAELDAATA
ncbi:MAG TPA: heme ABC transporter ATP-binding protein, partial [Acidimicrobiaceae bacterium]|nr:heme ABC transporter ATP-binding protein [Acidimicrobiaceae bacterium]